MDLAAERDRLGLALRQLPAAEAGPGELLSVPAVGIPVQVPDESSGFAIKDVQGAAVVGGRRIAGRDHRGRNRKMLPAPFFAAAVVHQMDDLAVLVPVED